MIRGVVDVGIAEHEQRARGRAVHEPDRGFEHGGEGALAAAERPGDVEAVLRQKLVEVVARNPPGEVRVALPDQRRMAIAEVAHPGIDLPAAAALADDRVELVLVRRAHAHAKPVVGDDLQLLEVVGGAAGHDGVGAAGVVADHPSEGGVLVRGGVRRERELVALLGQVRELVVDDAGLHSRQPPPGVDLEDLAQVLRVVDHHCDVAGLTRQAGTAAPREDRRAVLVADRDRGNDVVHGARQHHSDRGLAVVGAVVRVDGAVAGVEQNLAVERVAQVALERLDVDLVGVPRPEHRVADAGPVLRAVPPRRDGRMGPVRAGRSHRGSIPRPGRERSGRRAPSSGSSVPSKRCRSARTWSAKYSM